jgi:hypothetical protein
MRLFVRIATSRVDYVRLMLDALKYLAGNSLLLQGYYNQEAQQHKCNSCNTSSNNNNKIHHHLHCVRIRFTSNGEEILGA